MGKGRLAECTDGARDGKRDSSIGDRRTGHKRRMRRRSGEVQDQGETRIARVDGKRVARREAREARNERMGQVQKSIKREGPPKRKGKGRRAQKKRGPRKSDRGWSGSRRWLDKMREDHEQ